MLKKVLLPVIVVSFLLPIIFYAHAGNKRVVAVPVVLKKLDTTLTYSNNSYSVTVRLSSFGKFGYKLSALTRYDSKVSSEYAFTLDYPVYHFELGDVNRDGNVDICLGVIKPTHFDSTLRKRLFIYKLDEGRIRPLWLGSRVSHELVDFRYVRENNYPLIRTIEQENNGNYLVADYEWKGFGLAITKFLLRNSTKKLAYDTFYRS